MLPLFFVGYALIRAENYMDGTDKSFPYAAHLHLNKKKRGCHFVLTASFKILYREKL